MPRGPMGPAPAPSTEAASSIAAGSLLIPAQTSTSPGGMGWSEGPED